MAKLEGGFKHTGIRSSVVKATSFSSSRNSVTAAGARVSGSRGLVGSKSRVSANPTPAVKALKGMGKVHPMSGTMASSHPAYKK